MFMLRNKLKTMLKTNVSSASTSCLLALGLSLTSLNTSAHDPNTATLVVSQATSGKYFIQLDSALTGVEAQINETYSRDAYQTAEQFEDLAREHFINSFTFSINDQPIALANAKVQLGHGTQFIAEAQNIPETITSIELTDTFFKDLYGNKMTVVFTSKQLPKTNYVLNSKNDHHLSLDFIDGQWQESSSNGASEASHSHSHDIAAGHYIIDANDESLGMSADTVLSNDAQQALATMTQKATSTPLSSSVYVLSIGALIASLFSMLWFIKKKS